MNKLFTPRTPASPELLDAYAKGNLPPDQQHEVELLLEASPLHREAVEGLRAVPGASFAEFGKHRPGAGSSTPWLIGGGLLVAAALIAWAITASNDGIDPMTGPLATNDKTSAPSTEYAFDTNSVITTTEKAAAEELPESLRIGHEPMDERPQVSTESTIVRDNPVEPIEPRTIEPKSTANNDRLQQPKHAPRVSRRLVFLHGLKVVHPDELYPERMPKFFQTGVPANKPSALSAHIEVRTNEPTQTTVDTAAWNKLQRDMQPKVSYLDYMDHALAAFSNGDHRSAFDELQYLLTQFPGDVNALFYSGLCCYNLGRTAKAGGWFMRVLGHKVDSFSEEADWYRALCIENLHGAKAAAKEFKRIAKQGGFYAEKAKEKLN